MKSWKDNDAGNVCVADVPASSRVNRPPLAVRLMPAPPDQDNPQDIFDVVIRGSVHVPDAPADTNIQVTLSDISSGPDNPQPIRTENSPNASTCREFLYESGNGTLPRGWSTLDDWNAVVSVNLSQFCFTRRGERTLRLSVAILSVDTGQSLAAAHCTCFYQNSRFGYLDLEENRSRIQRLAANLLEVACHIENRNTPAKRAVLQDWIDENNPTAPNASALDCGRKWINTLCRRVECLVNKGRPFSVQQWCAELNDISTLSQRCDILNRAMRIIAADEIVTRTELALIRNLAQWLHVEPERFRTMAETLLPATRQETPDLELLLGITETMDPDMLRRQLSQEYRKWNSRVTHQDKQVRYQAGFMLDLIAETRTRLCP